MASGTLVAYWRPCRSLLLYLALLALALPAGCASGSPNGIVGNGSGDARADGGDACGPATCPEGCCDTNGLCRTGTLDQVCGNGGHGCQDCLALSRTCLHQACTELGPCVPGDTSPCGSCGTKVCGTEEEWGPCEGEGECEPGLDQSGGACGNCGTEQRSCQASCTWGEWQCVGEGECTPGTTQIGGACGEGGVQERLCEDNCTWSSSWTCMYPGDCTPGTVETGADCGTLCGHLERVCQQDSLWSGWSCVGEGVCSPGDQGTEQCGVCRSRSRTCQTDCTWSAWSACAAHCTCEVGGCTSSDGSVHADAGKVFTTTSCDQAASTASVSCASVGSCTVGACSGSMYYRSCNGTGSCRSNNTGAASATINADSGKVFTTASCSQAAPTASVSCASVGSCTVGACSGSMYYRSCNGTGSCRSDNTGAVSAIVYADSCKVFDDSCASLDPGLGYYCDTQEERLSACQCRIFFRGCTGSGQCRSDNTCSTEHITNAPTGMQFTETCHMIDGDCP